MNPEMTYKSKSKVLHIKATGGLNKEVGAVIAERALYTIGGCECNGILCDYSEVKVASSFIAACENPSYLKKWGIPRYYKLAVVYPPEYKEILEFWETVARNHGFIARVFAKKDDALDWLCPEK